MSIIGDCVEEILVSGLIKDKEERKTFEIGTDALIISWSN
jgi:hypothetical protein